MDSLHVSGTPSHLSSQVPGIGKVTERMLNALDVTTCGDLYKRRALLLLLFSAVSFQHFLRVCLGMGSTDVDRWGPLCVLHAMTCMVVAEMSVLCCVQDPHEGLHRKALN